MDNAAANFLARLAKPKWAAKPVALEEAGAQAAALLASEFSLAEAGTAAVELTRTTARTNKRTDIY